MASQSGSAARALIPLVSMMSFFIRSYSSIGLAGRVIAAVSLQAKARPFLRGQVGSRYTICRARESASDMTEEKATVGYNARNDADTGRTTSAHGNRILADRQRSTTAPQHSSCRWCRVYSPLGPWVKTKS